jgi:hypothetical protein
MENAKNTDKVIKVTNKVHILPEKKEMTESEIMGNIDELLDLLNKKKNSRS